MCLCLRYVRIKFYYCYLPQNEKMHRLSLMISELDERMRDLKNELQSFEGEEYDDSHKRKAIEALKRMENWNLFSDTHEVCDSYIYECVFFLFVCLLVLLFLFYFPPLSIEFSLRFENFVSRSF